MRTLMTELAVHSHRNIISILHLVTCAESLSSQAIFPGPDEVISVHP
jgi:hypothetical protein